ncbi:MAG: hypothetical protein GX150_01335 [Firmicutes bacterium]|nr:hypothetical protein [Bacillota bacterium]
MSTTIAFKITGLSAKAKKALERAPNRSEYIRRAIEFYENRSEYDLILEQLGEIKAQIAQLAGENADSFTVTSREKGDNTDQKKAKLEQELLAGLEQF